MDIVMDDSIKEFQKIQILLAEYSTLRTEVLSRYNAQFQSSAVLVTVFIGLTVLTSTNGLKPVLIALMIVTALIFIAVLIWIDVDIAKAARRLRAIEADVNQRAGERLLVWETDTGLGGIVGRHILRPPIS
jgi:ABC-type transport system involved in Fe-S cluster assembly fused permease/ATPase subunit